VIVNVFDCFNIAVFAGCLYAASPVATAQHGLCFGFANLRVIDMAVSSRYTRHQLGVYNGPGLIGCAADRTNPAKASTANTFFISSSLND